MNKFVFPRYIKREDAQKVLCGWCGICENPTLEDLEKCDDICPQFAQIPDADVIPALRGKWLPHKDEFGMYFECSCCHKSWYRAALAADNFCAYCGADMRGGDSDE